ncbi:unnamed protein product, partial [Linum tenue]
DKTTQADFVVLDRESDRFFGISAEKLFQDNDRMRGPPPAHLLQIEGMTLKFDIKLTDYNIANPTSEYTIWKIGLEDDNKNSNDHPESIEEIENGIGNDAVARIGVTNDDALEKNVESPDIEPKQRTNGEEDFNTGGDDDVANDKGNANKLKRKHRV